jgi:SAM-dependent methyltransferase
MIDDEVALASWEESADAWDDFVESGLDYYRSEFHGPALLEACAPVAGGAVLDLGCGQGWFSRQLARAGAGSVAGLDWSERLVTHAQRHELATGLGIRYQVGDAARADELLAGSRFDLVTACMSLMDMPRPGDALAAARRLLRPGGRIVASVSHPASDTTHRRWARDAAGNKLALEIDGYFEAKPGFMDWNMKRLSRRFRTVQYRYTLARWSEMIAGAGLVITRMWEPRPTVEALARRPELADAKRVPFILIFGLRAAAG